MPPSIEKLLAEVRQFIRPPKERTLFSLGGRGYYENPTSDLLAFFMAPEAEHGFNGLFLEAFFSCMMSTPSGLRLSGVSIDREVRTSQGNRVDLVVKGTDWVLLIENKIRHWQANPFEDYDELGRLLAGGQKPMKVILSPEGVSDAPGWEAVSYQAYCKELGRRLEAGKDQYRNSKWAVFARELVLHLESELYHITMTEDEVKLVEQHHKEIAALKRLSGEYRAFLAEQLEKSLNANPSGLVFTTWHDDWAVRCRCEQQWGRAAELALWSPATYPDQSWFGINVYLTGLDEGKKEQAYKAFSDLKPSKEGAWLLWMAKPGIASREEAIREACRLAAEVSKLFR